MEEAGALGFWSQEGEGGRGRGAQALGPDRRHSGSVGPQVADV